MRTYPYRTTFDKIERTYELIAEAGDTVVSAHFIGGRDWVFICRTPPANPLIDELHAMEPMLDRIEAAVERGVRRGAGGMDAHRTRVNR